MRAGKSWDGLMTLAPLDFVSSGRLAKWPPRTVLAWVLVLSVLPFLIVELFPGWLKLVMVPASYVVFHNIAEFFSIMVSLSVFGIGWYTYDQSRDRHALFLSVVFLAIGLLDFMHTLSNAAMPAFFTANSTNKSSQFWIAARFFGAAAFLASAYVYPDSQSRWLSKRALLTGVLLLSGLAFTGIVFFPSLMPATFIAGVGLTPFKKVSEYLVILLLLLAAAAYWQRLTKTGDRLFIYYIAAFVVCIFSEQVFTLYTQAFDTYNVLGHIYKVAAFYLIYEGIFALSVSAPYVRLLATGEELRQEIAERTLMEEELRRHRDHLEDLVRERTEKLEAVNNQLREEITERRRVENEISRLNADLQRSVAELELANKELEAFSYSVSHDLRAPLRVIDAFSQKVLAGCGDKLDAEGKRLLEIIRRNTRNMAQLIDDLLAFSRNCHVAMKKERVNLDRIVEDTIQSLQTEDREGEIHWKKEHLPEVYGDPALLSLVMANLLSNALKFTRTRPQALIEIGPISKKDGASGFYVKDNGVGFDRRYADKLFGLFQRLHSQEEFEGTGLGLANIQRIIQRHGGRIWAEGGLERGATFFVLLPDEGIKP